MIPIVSLLFVVLVSLLITRVAAVALTFTGLAWEAARFQARSAFTGVGFTTNESESIVNHPVRRRIVMLLMLFGNVGFVTAVSALMLSFIGAQGTGQGISRFIVLTGGLAALWAVSRSRWVDERVSRLIGWALQRWTSLDVRDYANLLHLCGEDYGVAEIMLEPHSWLAGRKLGDLALPEEGVLVLGVQRAEGSYIGAPLGSTVIAPNDTVIVYGRAPRIGEIDFRRGGSEGDRAHAQACEEERAQRARPEKN